MEITKVQIVDLPKILVLQRLCYHENALRYNDFNIAPIKQTIEELGKEFQNVP